MFIIKQEIKESIRKLSRAWRCRSRLINRLVYGNISRGGGQLWGRGIKPIFWKLNRAHTKRALQLLKRSTSRSHKLISRSDSL